MPGFDAFITSLDNVPLFLRDAATDMLPIRMWRPRKQQIDPRERSCRAKPPPHLSADLFVLGQRTLRAFALSKDQGFRPFANSQSEPNPNEAGQMISAIHTAANFAVAYVKDWLAGASSLRELEQIAPEDRARTLRDWNLTPAEFGSAMHYTFASQDLLSCAMRTLDIEQEQFGSEHIAWYRDMQRSCVTCPYRSRCRKELIGSSFVRHYRDFCANSANFTEILAGKSKTPSASALGA